MIEVGDKVIITDKDFQKDCKFVYGYTPSKEGIVVKVTGKSQYKFYYIYNADWRMYEIMSSIEIDGHKIPCLCFSDESTIQVIQKRLPISIGDIVIFEDIYDKLKMKVEEIYFVYKKGCFYIEGSRADGNGSGSVRIRADSYEDIKKIYKEHGPFKVIKYQQKVDEVKE